MSEKKMAAAKKAVEFVEDGMVLGLGTGRRPVLPLTR